MKDLSKRRRVETEEILGDRRYIYLDFLEDQIGHLLGEFSLNHDSIPSYLEKLSKKQLEEALEWTINEKDKVRKAYQKLSVLFP